MRSNRLWIGVTCGVALALCVVAAVDAGTQTAGAQPGDRMWARVNSDGACPGDTKSTDVNCNPTNNAPPGDYVVTFPENVSGCAWTATPLLNEANPSQNPVPQARIAVTARVQGAPSLVRVWVFSPAGLRTANSVSVQVLC
jgi:hypothetical protein